LFALAEAEGVPPAVAADRIAEQRMADAASADGDRGIWLPEA
jgi:valine dehydrogenase (NAD+)